MSQNQHANAPETRLSFGDLRRELTSDADVGSPPERSLLEREGGAFLDVPLDEALDGSLVKQNLDVILLALVRTTDGETHGKALMNRLSDLFGTHLSPGTLYPRLHALEDAGLLEVHERVRTKEYSVADDEAVAEFVGQHARQHLLLGQLLRDALVEVDTE